MSKGEERDELDLVKGELQAKDFTILCDTDKCERLEQRVNMLEGTIKQMLEVAADRDKRLEEQIASLTRDAKDNEKRSQEMEQLIVAMRKDRVESRTALMNELNETKNTYKAQLDARQTELQEAHDLIKAVKEFTMVRGTIEKEIQDLKDQLSREQREHQEALNDVERAAMQEKEKLRREMNARIEETRVLMIQQTEDQLHYKTKRTILENDQLAKEVAYHIRQSELLQIKNEQLGHECIVLENNLLTAKQLEEDLARRNHSYQKAARILLFKLQEQHLSANMETIKEIDELKHLIKRNEEIKQEIQKEQQNLERVKASIEEKTRKAEGVGAAEEAVKFLYQALEDVELEELVNAEAGPSFVPDEAYSRPPEARLDQLTVKQRQDFTRHLLRTAVSLRIMMQKSLDLETPAEGRPGPWSHVLYQDEKKPKVNVEDILALEIDLKQPEPLPTRRVTCGAQTTCGGV